MLVQEDLSDKAETYSIIEYYNNRPSIEKTLTNLRLLENEEKFQDNNEILQKVNTKKVVGIDSVPPNFVKLAAEPPSQPLTEAINMCLKQNNFSKNAKGVSVVLLDRGKSNKYDIASFRAVSVLNTFSKIQVIKEQIVLGTKKFLSIKISPYRKLYSTNYVITSFIENRPEKLNQNFPVDLS